MIWLLPNIIIARYLLNLNTGPGFMPGKSSPIKQDRFRLRQEVYHMISAIVYSSQTGHTKQYAKYLSDALSLPYYDLARGIPAPKGRDLIFMGWLFAGKIKGYEKAAKGNRVRAVCASGMGPGSEKLVAKLRKENKIPADVPVFYMQGGFDMKALPLPMRAIMSVKNKSIAEGLLKAGTMDAQQTATYKMTQGKYSAVDKENLAPVVAWYRSL